MKIFFFRSVKTSIAESTYMSPLARSDSTELRIHDNTILLHLLHMEKFLPVDDYLLNDPSTKPILFLARRTVIIERLQMP